MKKENRSVFKAWTMITQVGITFLTPIGLCVFIGYYLDKHFQKNYWFIILFFLGVLAAFRNVYYLTKSFYEKDLKKYPNRFIVGSETFCKDAAEFMRLAKKYPQFM
mgnify:CR=1 FL=1